MRRRRHTLLHHLFCFSHHLLDSSPRLRLGHRLRLEFGRYRLLVFAYPRYNIINSIRLSHLEAAAAIRPLLPSPLIHPTLRRRRRRRRRLDIPDPDPDPEVDSTAAASPRTRVIVLTLHAEGISAIRHVCGLRAVQPGLWRGARTDHAQGTDSVHRVSCIV
ncbi:hypothetical protein B0H16DRAFT_1571433 [Mycena metata]|uniref:Uncharacterized protein n=1 Tax=Mycena metata TaxID=1033252 RepID=A0AAD7IAT7_9AGAR|nr:hypothetical protein B0H16DRAFT_1571433 [Mycena metata]